ncbi:hypothetical protein ACLX1H_006180 [Fusarium chlamydosporum]
MAWGYDDVHALVPDGAKALMDSRHVQGEGSTVDNLVEATKCYFRPAEFLPSKTYTPTPPKGLKRKKTTAKSTESEASTLRHGSTTTCLSLEDKIKLTESKRALFTQGAVNMTANSFNHIVVLYKSTAARDAALNNFTSTEVKIGNKMLAFEAQLFSEKPIQQTAWILPTGLFDKASE